MSHQHPFRAAALHTFMRDDEQSGGVLWIARFYPYDVYPIFFHGSTREEAEAAANAFREEQVAKHEAKYIALAKAREARAAARAAKEAAE